MIYLDLGCVDRAIDLLECALSIAREINDLRYESAWLSYLGMAYRLKGAAERARKAFERGLNTVREIGDLRGEGIHLSRYGLIYQETAHNLEFQQRALAIGIEDVREKSYQLLRLSKALLAASEISQAYKGCKEAVSLDVQSTQPQAKWVLGILHLHRSAPQAYGAFVAAQNASRTVLHETSTLYKPCYTLAAALVGQAICEPLWADEEHRLNLLTPALDEYRHALSIAAAPGIVQDAIRDLELVRSAGIEGLEPVFELLESAEHETDILNDLPDLESLVE
jgi:tetratricopeptide (TPR) repeat protein